MNKLLIPLLFIIFIVVGCSDPKIDATNDKSMETSIEKVRQSLQDDKKEKFDNAIKVIAFSQVNFKGLLTDGESGINSTKNNIKDILNGKTGNEIILEAENIRLEREKKEKIQALSEIKELEEKQMKANNAKDSLKKFIVARSRFYKEPQKYGRDKPIIELTVKNGTSHAVSRAYFKGTIASPNRSVPWIVETFNYKISGGLETEEIAKWSLAPNQFSDWGTVNVPPDAILTVEVEQLDGPDGEPLFSSRIFSEREEKRLTKLKSEYEQ